MRSAIMSVGSPALAAYSLLLTSLNARIVYHKVETSKHRHKKSLAKVLVSIQQTLLAVTDDLHLLNYILISYRWRKDIEDHVELTNSWPVKTVLFVAWVAAPFAFTVVSAFVALNDPSDNSYGGYSTGILWLWLLCLVIGWLWAPTSPGNELRSALSFANQQAVKRSIKAQAKEARTSIHSAADKKQEAEQIPEGTSLKANLPRRQSTAASESYTDDQLDSNLLTISANSGANQGVASMRYSTHPPVNTEWDGLFFLPKPTSLNRDEHRLTATFNYSRTMRYLVLVDNVFEATERLSRETDEVGLSGKCLVEVVSLILNRREALSLGLYPLYPRKRRLCSLRAHSLRCSKRRLWPSFSSAE